MKVNQMKKLLIAFKIDFHVVVIFKIKKKIRYAIISEETCDALDKIMSNIIKEEGSIAVENLFCGKKPIEAMLLEIIRYENPHFTIHASDKEPLNDEFKKFQINHTQIDYTKENPFANYKDTSKVVLFMSYPDFPGTHVSKSVLELQFMEKVESMSLPSMSQSRE